MEKPPRQPAADLPAPRGILIAWQLAGLTTLADWIGSRQAWFPYVAPQAVADPAAYLWNRALPQAMQAIGTAGLGATGVAPFQGLRRLFPGITRPPPIQS